MIENDLLTKINSGRAAKTFADLYGEIEAPAEKQRYAKLMEYMLKAGKEGFPETELCDTSGDLRVFSAPGRTELAGNHTDHNHGKVLAASIQLDNVAIAQKRNDNTVFFRSSGFPDVKVKLTDSGGAPDLQPKPEEEGKTEALIRGIAAELTRLGRAVGGFSANAASTVLPGSGLSSSAAAEVLLCYIFESLYSETKLDSVEIARIGQFAENAYFKKPCGLMDQIACATGGAVAIDFANAARPEVKKINFDLSSAGYALCVVNTRGNHADLTPDYASIPEEMKKVAAFFGKSTLGELSKETVLSRAAQTREAIGDRALLRSLHFFDENTKVETMTSILIEMEKADTDAAKQRALKSYLDLVNVSGDSSWELLQNVYSPRHPETQGISVALALTKEFLRKQNIYGACRVHGGGFAGTIQAYIPLDAMDTYKSSIEKVFGPGSVTTLKIRPVGPIELTF